MATAEGSQNPEDYYEVILTDTSRTEAYLGSDKCKGLIECLINDGELTREENAIFQKLKGGLDKKSDNNNPEKTDVLGELQQENEDGYHEVCYQIGEACLFYYDINVEKDKYATAAAWFKNAGEGYPTAMVYCNISECLQNIAKYEKAGQISKLYEEYTALWEKVKGLQTASADYDDDLKLRVWNEMVNMISNNAGEFCEVTTQAELIQVLRTIDTDSSDIKNVFLEENIKSLKANIETTTKNIESVNTQSGS